MQRLSRWLRKRRLWLQRGSLILLGIGILAVLVGGYALHWSWTGFHKTLWDWMQLLIIPAVLAIIGFLFNQAEHRSEQEAARQQAAVEQQMAEQRAKSEQQMAEQRAMTERFLAQWRLQEELKRKDEYQREALLQTYLDRMSELLIEKGLRGSAPGDEVRHVARARTLTVLQRLDPERKTDVLWFLYESGLIDRHDNKRIVDVSDADWSYIHLDGSQLRQIDLSSAVLSHSRMQKVDLRGANLQGTILRQADLRGANLRGAILRDADLANALLAEADLTGANLRGADLSQADLTRAILQESTLREATLQGANLSYANIQGATYSQEQLATARSWGVIQ